MHLATHFSKHIKDKSFLNLDSLTDNDLDRLNKLSISSSDLEEIFSLMDAGNMTLSFAQRPHSHLGKLATQSLNYNQNKPYSLKSIDFIKKQEPIKNPIFAVRRSFSKILNIDQDSLQVLKYEDPHMIDVMASYMDEQYYSEITDKSGSNRSQNEEWGGSVEAGVTVSVGGEFFGTGVKAHAATKASYANMTKMQWYEIPYEKSFTLLQKQRLRTRVLDRLQVLESRIKATSTIRDCVILNQNALNPSLEGDLVVCKDRVDVPIKDSWYEITDIIANADRPDRFRWMRQPTWLQYLRGKQNYMKFKRNMENQQKTYRLRRQGSAFTKGVGFIDSEESKLIDYITPNGVLQH